MWAWMELRDEIKTGDKLVSHLGIRVIWKDRGGWDHQEDKLEEDEDKAEDLQHLVTRSEDKRTD
jgi:hypothetical protein